jgi:hypothetical protein
MNGLVVGRHIRDRVQMLQGIKGRDVTPFESGAKVSCGGPFRFSGEALEGALGVCACLRVIFGLTLGRGINRGSCRKG